MYCGKCGNVLQENEKFCSKCGTARNSKTCIKCGNILQENEKFCSKCGTAVMVNNCSKCGKPFEENEKFCSKCGNSRIPTQNNMSTMNSFPQNNVNNNMGTMNSFPQNNVNNNMPVKESWKQWNKQKILVVSGVFAVVFLIVFVSLTFNGSLFKKSGGSRTIMIYMVGADLESRSGLASRDLEDLDYSYTSKNGINVLLIAGGSNTWKNNYVDVSETSIYELGPLGFEKVDTRAKNNMGAIDNLTYFLNYAYKNYKSNNYDLLFWNHGGGVDGSEYDELTNDNLKISEMKAALEKSTFKDHKLEVVSFRTCLNATVEIANVFKDYANYLVASEEYTIGSQADSALRFINDIKKSDSAIEYGKKQISVYEETVQNTCAAASMFTTDSKEICYGATYSIIDLSKIAELKKTVNNFANDLDAKLNTDYLQMLKIRSTMDEYGGEESNSFEMVDLYDLADKMKDYSSNASKVKSIIDDAIVYNWTNTDYSHGLSVYFPYHNAHFLGTYDSVTASDNYSKFISKFYLKKRDYKSTSFTKFSSMGATVERKAAKSTDLEMELTEDQINNIDKKGVLVFVDTHDGLYQPIYNGRVEIEGNKLKANIKDQLIKISDIEYEDSSMWMIMSEVDKTDEYVDFKVWPKLAGLVSAIDPEEIDSNIIIRIDKEHPTGYIRSVTIDSKDKKESNNKFSLFSPVGVNLNDYRFLKFYNSRYKLIDDNGNFDNSFESTGSLWISFFKTNEFKFIKADLDEEDVYAVFRIKDMSGQEYNSKPVKLTK